jgi:hypothetical protein
LARISGTPQGELRAVAGPNGRAWVADLRGRAVRNPGVTIDAGMIADVRPQWIPFGGTHDEFQTVRSDQVRDVMVSTAPDYAGLILARDQVVEKWCRDHGKRKDGLTLPDIITIRSLPEWQSPG